MALFVVGCSVKATLFIGDSAVELGNCYVACIGGSQVGMGYCSIAITVTLRSFTLNISRTSQAQAAQGLEQVSVFITDQLFLPLDLHDYDYPTALMSWAIPNQLNCKRAKEDKASYASVSSHSNCQEAEAPIGGYFCNCSQGFYGNPYVVNGCVLPESDPPLLPLMIFMKVRMSSHLSPISPCYFPF
jgi:hypothetical protein